MTKKSSVRHIVGWALVILTVLILLAPAVVANAEDDETYDTYFDYIIKSYHVDVVAHADNTYDIIETIDVRFNTYKHGIYRYIPTRYNGKLTPVTNIDTYGTATKISKRGINKYIRLGDADQTIIGDKTYTIAYSIDMGQDENDGLDAIYLNIIGADWNTKMYEVTFDVDVSELEGTEMVPSVSVGYEGSTGSLGTMVKKTDSHIIGSMTRILMPYEGLTLFVAMPEGALALAKDAFDWRKVLTYGVPLLTLLLLLVWSMRYGKKRNPIPVIAFYPPEGMNPTELGYVIDERVDGEDVGALIVYWATKGYLSIKEERFGKFTLIKSGEMDVGAEPYEMSAFKKLWRLGDGEQVTSSQLRNKYYTQVASIQKKAKEPFESGRKRLYEDKPKKKSEVIMILGAACLGVLAFVGGPLIDASSDGSGAGSVMAIIMMGGYLFLSLAYEGIYKRRKKRKAWKTVLFYSLHIILYFFALFVGIAIFKDALSAGELTALLFVPILVTVVRPAISRYTDYGFDLLQRVLGFKEFLKTAEKDRLEILMAENSNYVYDMLPYTMVLGVSDTWVKKFNVLMTEPPNWYTAYGTGAFTTASLMRSMTRTTTSMSSVASSRPSSSGSSGGGGGFSGGGGGGGGGGSW